jgi:hypothetical protein
MNRSEEELMAIVKMGTRAKADHATLSNPDAIRVANYICEVSEMIIGCR